jgi:hypothetical protein
VKIKMLKMRITGVSIPKRAINDRFNTASAGVLEILDTTDQGLHRMVKLARFTREEKYVDTLYDPQIVWCSGGKMVLTGFERGKNQGAEVVDYAQSWLCFVGVEPPTPPEGR